jgi:hypothetical protein
VAPSRRLQPGSFALTASTGLDHQVKELVIMNQLCLVPPKAARQCVQQITTAGEATPVDSLSDLAATRIHLDLTHTR